MSDSEIDNFVQHLLNRGNASILQQLCVGTLLNKSFIPLLCFYKMYKYSKSFTSFQMNNLMLYNYRSYISFDILRRVMANYFGYDILYVMNITDIDDKIIKRARQQHLYEKYVKEQKSLSEIIDDATQVVNYYETVVKETTDPDKKNIMQKMLDR